MISEKKEKKLVAIYNSTVQTGPDTWEPHSSVLRLKEDMTIKEVRDWLRTKIGKTGAIRLIIGELDE